MRRSPRQTKVSSKVS